MKNLQLSNAVQNASETFTEGYLSESAMTCKMNGSYSLTQCVMCQQDLIEAMNQSLKSKYESMDNSDKQYRDIVDSLLYSMPTSNQINTKEKVYQSEGNQYLKRVYFNEEFQFKIQGLGQFYKYRKCCPMHFGKNEDRNLYQIMFQFYDQYRKTQYKKIKKRLKQEENISLSTMKQSSDMCYGWGYQKSQNCEEDKSRMLSTFIKQSHDQTHFELKHICERIQKKLGSVRLLSFKPRDCGEHRNNQKKFIKFLMKQQNKDAKKKCAFSIKGESNYKSKIKDIVDKQINQLNNRQILQVRNNTKRNKVGEIKGLKVKEIIIRKRSEKQIQQANEKPKKMVKSKSLKLNRQDVRLKKIHSQYQGALRNKLQFQTRSSLKVVKRDLSRSRSKNSGSEKIMNSVDGSSHSKKITTQDNPFTVKIENYQTLKPSSIPKRPKVDLKLRTKSTRDQNDISQENKVQRQGDLVNKIISAKLNIHARNPFQNRLIQQNTIIKRRS